jgi:polysaccharide pyruvyl transferase WcaK-like protein
VTVTHANLNGMTLPLWRWHARKHEIFSVRDLTAFKRLKELKFSNLRHVPDLFFLSKFEELPSPPIDKPYFVINLRETYPGNPNPLEYQKEILARLSELLKQFPLHSLILCHQVERDGVFMEKVADSIADKHRIHHIASCLDEETALPLYQHADAILSNRLHCIMFGVLLNIPPYALTAVPHHVKITDAWREYKLDSYLLPSDKPLSQISLAKPNFDSLVHSRRKAILNLFE